MVTYNFKCRSDWSGGQCYLLVSFRNAMWNLSFHVGFCSQMHDARCELNVHTHMFVYLCRVGLKS